LKKDKYHVIGVMSGTSLDGIDLAQIEFSISSEKTKTVSSQWKYNILNTETIPYTEVWKRKLQDGISFSEIQLQVLNREYTQYLSEVIGAFIQKYSINKIDAVCSHGHTILHQPYNGITLQIGNLPVLSQLIKQKVVCDFRVEDVTLGGQGAPLVPIGDELLFNEYDYCLNLGGFANCSYNENGVRLAYDISPVNIVLNRYAEMLGFDYDDKGKIASSGNLNLKVEKQLNNLNYYKKLPPKSLGLEWVQDNIYPIWDDSGMISQDILRTFTEHVAKQIAFQFKKGSSVLITGGGAFNDFLISRINSHKEITITIPSKKIIEYKEALVFGLLGVLRLRNEVNCLASVTGAKKDHSSGFIYNP